MREQPAEPSANEVASSAVVLEPLDLLARLAAPWSNTGMRCAACRAEVADDVQRCPSCDEPVRAPAENELDDEPNALGTPPKLGCGALLLGAGVLFVLLVLVWLATWPPNALGGIR